MTEPNLIAKWPSWAPRLLSVFRIVAALIFMMAGSMKIFAFPAGVPPDAGTVELFSQMGVGGLLEVFCGALLLVGLFTRPFAFILSGEMSVAFFHFSFPMIYWLCIIID